MRRLLFCAWSALLLFGCDSRRPAAPETSSESAAVRPATRPLPPPPEPPPVVWGTQLRELDGWEYDGPRAAGDGPLFAPVLAPGQTCSLTLQNPLVLQPRHRYQLTVELQLAPYTRRRISVILDQGDQRQVTLLLRPVRHSGWIDPPPVMVTETTPFITPGDVRGVRFRLAFEACGDNRGLPLQVRSLRLEDCGPITMAATPGPNLQRSPGACFEGRGRTIVDLGGAFVAPPVLVEFRARVRGAGRLIPECRRSGPGYERLMGLRGPEIELTDHWREVVWEVGIPATSPETVSFHFVADLFRSDTTYLDDVEIRILSAGGVRHH